MPDTPQPLRLFMIRYKHNHEIIDITGRGENGRDAFERYVALMKSWGNDASSYKFISARPLPDMETRSRR